MKEIHTLAISADFLSLWSITMFSLFTLRKGDEPFKISKEIFSLPVNQKSKNLIVVNLDKS